MVNETLNPKNQPSLIISIPLPAVIAVALAWSFLVRDLEILQSWDVLAKNMLLAGFIAGISALYHQTRWNIQVSRQHLFWFFGFAGVLISVNWHVLTEALACDELYHAGMASLAVRVMEKYSTQFPIGRFLGSRPMTEAVGLISISVLSFAVIIGILWKNIENKLASNASPIIRAFFSIWIISTLLGQACRNLPYRSEIHPPLRLLPLFLSHSLFGYDDLSFKIPGILLLTLLATAVASYVATRRDNEDGYSKILATFAGLLVAVIPTVAHAATIVEPSIWCFGTWTICFLLMDRYLRDGNEDNLVTAAVVLGLGSLMRQNAIVLWPVFGIVLLIKRPNAMAWIKTLLPGTFVIPYLALVASGHHAAASGAGIQNILKSFEGAVGPELILRSTTAPWNFFGSILLLVALYHRAWRTTPGLIILWSLVPAYALYFSISDFLWGLGRYQAEYMGAAIAILIAASFANLTIKWRAPAILSSILLFGYSINVLRTLHFDTYWGNWSQKRITTESIYPYREGLGFLHRQNTDGHFAFVGGVPTYGWFLFYLRGFSYDEIQLFDHRQGPFEQAMQMNTSVEQVRQVTKDLGIRYIVVQWGDKRELQHRASWHNSVEATLRGADRDPNSGVVREYRFYGPIEGAIDIYRVGD